PRPGAGGGGARGVLARRRAAPGARGALRRAGGGRLMTAASPQTGVAPAGRLLRLTWTQPEDLVGHELNQAAQDGRDPERVAAIAARWRDAGGHPAPAR